MARLTLILTVTLTFIGAALASPFSKRTVSQIEADIQTISSDVTTLDGAIKAFPASGGSLLQALGIHTDATNLESALSEATTDTTNTAAFSESDSQAIISDVSAFTPTILDALSSIVGKKAAFAALPIGGIPALVLSDLQALDSSTTSFVNALLAKAPADQVAAGQALSNQIKAGFDSAIAAYSS